MTEPTVDPEVETLEEEDSEIPGEGETQDDEEETEAPIPVEEVAKDEPQKIPAHLQEERLFSPATDSKNTINFFANFRFVPGEAGNINFSFDAVSKQGKLLELRIQRKSAAWKKLHKAKRKLAFMNMAKAKDINVDTIHEYKHAVGMYFGVDPDVWTLSGAEHTEVKEENGFRITTVTGMYWGQEVYFLLCNPFYDARMKPIEDPAADTGTGHVDMNAKVEDKELVDYSQHHVKSWPINTDTVWQHAVNDQPWTPPHRRQKVAEFLCAKMAYNGANAQDNENLHIEGLHGVFELSISRGNHSDIGISVMEQLVQHVNSGVVAASTIAVTAIWHLSLTQDRRRMLAGVGCVEGVLGLLNSTIKKVEDQDMRNKLQFRSLGALSVSVIDKECRTPMVRAEPSMKTLFTLSEPLKNYPPHWDDDRRALAAQVLTNALIRDPRIRLEVVKTNGVPRLMKWMEEGVERMEDEAEFAHPSRSLGLKLMRCAVAVVQMLAMDDQALLTILHQKQLVIIVEGCVRTLVMFFGKFNDCTKLADWEVSEYQNMVEGLVFGMWGASYHAASSGDEGLTEELVSSLPWLGLQSKKLHWKSFGGRMCLDTARISYLITSNIACYALHERTAPFLIAAHQDAILPECPCDCLVKIIDSDPIPGGYALEYDSEGRIRAAGLTALALITSHPMNSKGEDCFSGYYRVKLLRAGMFGAVLRAIQTKAENEIAQNMIGETGAVTLMFLSTMATTEVEPWMIQSVLEIMEYSSQPKVVEHLMVCFWVLLRNPNNREQLKNSKEAKRLNDGAGTGAGSMQDDASELTEVKLKRESEVKKKRTSQASIPEERSNSGRTTSGRTNQARGSQHGDATPREALTTPRGGSQNGDNSKAEGQQPSGDNEQAEGEGESAEDWGLKALIRIAEKWLIKAQSAVGSKQDASVLKLYEFMIPSVWLYLIEEDAPMEPRLNDMSELDHPYGTRSETWWAIQVPHPQKTLQGKPMIRKAIDILLNVMYFNHECHAKMVQLSVGCLWNFLARTRAMESQLMELGLGNSLLNIAQNPIWPPALHDIAISFIADILEEWNNGKVFGQYNLRKYMEVMVSYLASGNSRLQASSLLIMAHLCYVAPVGCPNRRGLLAFCKDSIVQARGIEVLSQMLHQKFRALLMGEEELHPDLQAEISEVLKTEHVDGDGAHTLERLAEQQAMEDEELDAPPESFTSTFALLGHGLRLLRNLSVRKQHQVRIAVVSMMNCLRINSFFSQFAETPEELDVLNQVSAVLHNLASHPDNRTRFYKVELRGTSQALLQDMQQGGGKQTSAQQDNNNRRSLPGLERGFHGSSSGVMKKSNSSPNKLASSYSSPNKSTRGGRSSPREELTSPRSQERPKVRFPAIRGASAEETTRMEAPERSRTDQKKIKFLRWMQNTFTDPEASEAIRRATNETPGCTQRLMQREDVTCDQEIQSISMMSFDGWQDLERPGVPLLSQSLRRPLAHSWRPTHEARRAIGNNRWNPPISEYQENLQQESPLPSVASKLLATNLPTYATRDLAHAMQHLEDADSTRLPEAIVRKRPETHERTGGRMPITMLTQQTVDKHRGDERGPDELMALKVSVAPQRNRHVITFKHSDFTDEPKTCAKLSVFEHIQGSKVYKDLFPDYQLPNGKSAHYYYTMGAVVEEVEVNLRDPPPRPENMAAALQNAIPLDVVLGKVIKPPGAFEESLHLYKPMPPRAPLPDKHTLKVKDSKSLTPEAFGDLLEERMLFAMYTTKVTRKESNETRVRLEVEKPPTPKEPWVLPKSIFRPRVRESDSKDFWDSPKVEGDMMETDWNRLVAKDKLLSYLSRENKSSVRKIDDKECIGEIYACVKKNYSMIRSCFMYYASVGSGSPFHIQLNPFTMFLEDCKIPDTESKFLKRSDCDTVFIVANYVEKGKGDAINDDHALMRYEFMEALIRLGIAKYGKGQATTEPAEALEMLFQKCIIPNVNTASTTNPNDFRRDRLYFEEVDDIYKKHEKLLRAVYSRYRLPPKSGGVRNKMLGADGWEQLMADVELISEDFTITDARLCFLYSRMYLKDEMKDWNRNINITFIDFLDALGRLADSKSIPTSLQIEDAGYENWFQWHVANNASDTGESNPNYIPRRNSAGWGSKKTRPLYAKLEGVLDIMFRSLFFDSNVPDNPYNPSGLLSLLQKIDKNLGP